MSKNLNDVLAAPPPKRRAKVEQRAGELATLKDLRLAVEHTQQDLAASLGVSRRGSADCRPCTSMNMSISI